MSELVHRLPWHEEAKRLLDAGESVNAVARHCGRSKKSVRYAFNIGGFRDKKHAQARALTALRKSQRYQNVVTRGKRRFSKEGVAAYVAPPPAPKPGVTLPQISLPSLPPEVDRKPVIRFAPKVRVSVNEGAERIRRIHLDMIRRGKLRPPSDVEEVRI